MNWRKINEVISGLSEQEVYSLLEDERRIARRPTILIRLHQRFTTLRAARERAEILKEAVYEPERSVKASRRPDR